MLNMKVKRVYLEFSSHTQKAFLVFFFFIFLYLYEMIDDQQAKCGNHFIMYLSQTFMLNTLYLYSAICQLYFNKTERKQKIKWEKNFE